MLFAAMVSAQKVYVRGYVLNEEKRAVEFATVQIKETAMGTITNEKGYFEMKKRFILSHGKYRQSK